MTEAAMRRGMRGSDRARDFDHKLIGYVEVRNAERISGWTLDTREDAPPPHVVLVDGAEVLAVAAVDDVRQDVADRMRRRPAYHFDVTVPHGRREAAASLTVAAVDGATAARLSALCARRDRSLAPQPVMLSRATIEDRDAYQVLPNTIELEEVADDAQTSDFEIERLSDGALLIEITDLVSYLRSHNTVTGIQRTVCGLIEALLGPGGERHRPFYLCTFAEDLGAMRLFQEEDIADLIEIVFAGSMSVFQISKFIDRALHVGGIYRPGVNDTLLISGAYWIVPDFDRKIAAVRSNGAIIGTYIYDIIPITAPQWVATSTNQEVLESAFGVFSLSSFFITISEFVKRDLGRLLKAELDCQKPIAVAPLPHEIPGRRAHSRAETVSSSRRHTSPYVLCVCTLEGRKNHMLLFRVWSGLLRKYGPEKVPDLVLVGKWGWRIADFRENCELTQFLDGKIIVKSGVQDDDLAELFQGCLLTVFPSFVEGWGLPVGESLTFGKLCVASNASSIPEVGGDFVDYFDPYDYDQAFAAIERAIFDVPYRDRRAKDIAEGFKARSWEDLADALIRSARDLAVEARASALDSAVFPPSIEPGRPWLFDGLTTSQSLPWKDKQARFALVSGWGRLEPWGVWSRESSASIGFRVPSAAGSTVKVWLSLTIPNPPGAGEVAVVAGGHTNVLRGETLGATPRWIQIVTTTPPDQIILLRLVRPEAFVHTHEARRCYIGLCGIGYCDAMDRDTEAAMLRRMAGIVALTS